jgi:hypothetical protein
MAERDDWDERELDSEDDGSWESSASPLPPSEDGFRTWIPWLLWALIPLGLLVVWLLLSRNEPPPESQPAPVVMEEQPEASPPDVAEEPTEPEPAIEIPPLSESDALVRESGASLSEHPFLDLLLGADDLVRKFVVTVANIAEGTSPRRQLMHVRPEERFSVLQTSGRIVLDPASYHRYDPAAKFFASLNPEAVAKLYRLFDPLLEEAHAELGLSERKDFDDTLTRAIVVLLEVPVVEGPVRLRAVSVNYEFEDPRLEQLSAAQKHLVRMGPDNTRRIQKKLRELAMALGLEIPGAG